MTERDGVHWTIDAATGKPVRSSPRAKNTEIEVCAQCHSRRSQIADGYRAGLPFLDFYRPALLTQGLYYVDGQRRDEAEAQLRAALGLDRKFAPAYVNLADLLRAQRNDAQAEEVLHDGLRQAPEAAGLHYALGLTLVRLGHNADALSELQRAAKRAPDDARFDYVYAVALNGAGKSAAALAEIDRALAREPDNRDLLNAAIMFRRVSGDVAGARRYAERMLERYPDDPDAAGLMRELGGAH